MADNTPILTANQLRQLIPLNALLEEELIYLAKHSKISQLPAKKQIPLQDINEKLYLLQGKVTLYNNNVAMTTIRAGTDNARSALNRSRRIVLTLYSNTPVTLLWIDLQQLKQKTKKNTNTNINTNTAQPTIRRPKITIPSFTTKQLLKLTFFQSVFQQQSLTVIQKSRQIIQKKGTYLQKQQQTADSLYLILSGTAIEFHQNNGKNKAYRQLKKGDLCGGLAVLGQQQNTNVRLQSHALLLKIPEKVFLNYQQHSQQILKQRQVRDFLSKKQLLCIDVRQPEEYKKNHIQASVHIEFNYFYYPFAKLQKKWAVLKEQRAFVVYSQQQYRANAVAFQLQLQGIRCYILQDGFQSFPFEYTQHYYSLNAEKKRHEINPESAAVFDEVEQLLETEIPNTHTHATFKNSAKLLTNRAAIFAAQITGANRFSKRYRKNKKKFKMAWVIAVVLLFFGLLGLVLSPLGTELLLKLSQ